MSEIDRDAFLELLDQLLSDSDEEVLAAARTIRQQMAEAEVGWDLLLVQAPGDEDDHGHDGHDYDGPDLDEEEEDEPEAVSAAHGRASRTAQDDRAMIEELMTKHEISDATREELEEYKIDIDDGEFTEADHAYLLALYQRVTGKKR